MINVLVGDNILFEANLTDSLGTAITSGAGTLTVVDYNGSTVLATNVAHTSAGTYQFNKNTVGWGAGPLVETWKFHTVLGTQTLIASNNYRMVTSSLGIGYIDASELTTYYENIGDYFDGSEQAVVLDAFNEINTKLEAMGYKMPIRARADGFFDQPLRDWNAYSAIKRIISRRQTGYNREDEKPWFSYFGELAGSICHKFEKKEYNLDREVSVAEAGIGQGTKIVGTSPGQMENNWRGGIGTGFTDFTFERDWLLEVTGTGTAGTIGECEYRWSNDNGFTYTGTSTTQFDWLHLKDGVFVRFHRGTSTQGTNLFVVGDKWTWKTFPRNQAVAGKSAARSY